MKGDAYYFQHDYNPANDPKIICLLGNYGGLGYGIFWRVIEMLHQEKSHKLPLKNYVFEAIAKQMLTSVEQIEEVIKKCIDDYELFQGDQLFFWSNRVLQNIKKQNEISEVRSKAGKASVLARQISTNVEQSLTNGNKGKERKGKEKKRNLSIPPTSSEVVEKEKLKNKEVVLILDEFKRINPSINFGHKTQRAAAEWLVSQYGFDKALGTVKYAISIQGKNYAPLITTPYQLKDKIAALMIFYEKEPKNINLDNL